MLADMEKNINEVRGRIARACQRSHRLPGEVSLIAVSKGFEPSAVRAAFECGVEDFGENRVQEALGKLGQLADPKPYTRWHMVGHLQSNKARTAMGVFDIIHSVDSVKLAAILSQQAVKAVQSLIEVNVSGELSKTGFSVDEVTRVVNEMRQLSKLKVVGLMTVVPFVSDPEEVRPIFRKLRELRDYLGLEHLSMGMTDDYEVAVEEGATMVRIGRAIFGERRAS